MPTTWAWATILWCYLRNNAFKKDGVDYHNAADLTGQADHLGATIGADIVKQKLPTCNGGFRAIGFGKTDDKMYTELASDHPIDLCRYQVANSYMGRVGLINSGGESHGASRPGRRRRKRPSSTSGPAAWASSAAARRSNGR